MSWPTAEELTLAHRYLYYVLLTPVLSDKSYDRVEEIALETASKDSPIRDPGSSLASSYSNETVALAAKLLKDKK